MLHFFNYNYNKHNYLYFNYYNQLTIKIIFIKIFQNSIIYLNNNKLSMDLSISQVQLLFKLTSIILFTNNVYK